MFRRTLLVIWLAITALVIWGADIPPWRNAPRTQTAGMEGVERYAFVTGWGLSGVILAGLAAIIPALIISAIWYGIRRRSR